jgi:hypothetical protein
VVTTIENQFTDGSDLAFYDGVLCMHGLQAAQNRAACQLRRSGLELHTKIRSNHGPQIGNSLLTVHLKEYEDERLGLAARANGATAQESYAAN